jgi:uncharacterized membrane protein
MSTYDHSQSGGTRDRRRRILASFGQDNEPVHRHPVRRRRRDVVRRRAVYAIAAIAILVLIFELVAIVVTRR